MSRKVKKQKTKLLKNKGKRWAPKKMSKNTKNMFDFYIYPYYNEFRMLEVNYDRN